MTSASHNLSPSFPIVHPILPLIWGKMENMFVFLRLLEIVCFLVMLHFANDKYLPSVWSVVVPIKSIFEFFLIVIFLITP